MNPFEPGFIVSLKSGGDDMTVDTISGDDCSCVWRIDDGKPLKETFKHTSLELVDDGKAGITLGVVGGDESISG